MLCGRWVAVGDRFAGYPSCLFLFEWKGGCVVLFGVGGGGWGCRSLHCGGGGWVCRSLHCRGGGWGCCSLHCRGGGCGCRSLHCRGGGVGVLLSSL